MIINPFETFYTTLVEIGQVTGGGGYSNPDGVYSSLGEVMADIQPYSGGLAEKEYGLTEQVEKRIFCDNADFIQVGNVALIGRETYDILYVERWSSGIAVLLKKRTAL